MGRIFGIADEVEPFGGRLVDREGVYYGLCSGGKRFSIDRDARAFKPFYLTVVGDFIIKALYIKCLKIIAAERYDFIDRIKQLYSVPAGIEKPRFVVDRIAFVDRF